MAIFYEDNDSSSSIKEGKLMDKLRDLQLLKEDQLPVCSIYVGHLESKERLRIQPAQLFNFS